MNQIRTAQSIRLDIERTKQRMEHLTREQATGAQQSVEPIWNCLNLLCVYYSELDQLVGHVLQLPQQPQSPTDMILLLTDSNQDGELITEQAYNERLLLMSELDRATHLAVPVASEVASDVNHELNTLKRGLSKINSLTKKRA